MASGALDELTDSDTGSSSSSPPRISKYEKKFPTRGSQWSVEHLMELGIFYDEAPTGLRKFMTDLKSVKYVVRNDLCEMPKISHTLAQYTEDLWNFSYLFYKESGEGAGEVRDRIDKSTEVFKEKLNDMEEQVKTTGSDWKRLFFGWMINLLEFWRQLSMVLARLGQAAPREGRFSHLLTAFSRVCLLTPEPGEAFIERVIIKDTVVRGIPSLRFNTFQDKCLKLLIVTQVKLYNAFRGSHNAENFTYKSVDKSVLGQHGIQLVMERKGSFFFPCIVGILCIGTHIILTALHIHQDHFHQIEEKGVVDKTCRASISYTRPFDFMDVTDRQDLLECFFWFGYVQSNAYQFK